MSGEGYILPAHIKVDDHCTFCKRRVAALRNSDNQTEMVIQEGRFYMAWRVHHSCLLRMRQWAAQSTQKGSK